MSYIIYSSLAEDQKYTTWNRTKERVTPAQSVLIKGGHGKWDRHNLFTPHGIVNRVTSEEYEILRQVPQFRDHVEKGFLIVSAKEHAPEVVITDMNPDDKSGQLSEAHIEELSPTIEDVNGVKKKIRRKKKAEALKYV